MSFNIDVGLKFSKEEDNFCLFHAVHRILHGERITQEIYDCTDEYESPQVCKDCLDEEIQEMKG